MPQGPQGPQHAPGRPVDFCFYRYSIRLSALFHFHVHIHSLTDRSSVLPLRAPSAPPLASSNHRPPPAISTSFPYGLPSLTTAASTPPSFAQTDQIRLSFRNADTQNTRSLIHSLPSPATRIHTRTDNQLPSSADQHDRRIKSHFEYEVASSTFLSCPFCLKTIVLRPFHTQYHRQDVFTAAAITGLDPDDHLRNPCASQLVQLEPLPS